MASEEGGTKPGGRDGPAARARRASEEEIQVERAAHDITNEPLGDKELQGWYAFDFANSTYSTVVIGGFLPLLLQTAALAAAGYPEQCPNVVRDATEIEAVWGGWNITESEMYRVAQPDLDAGCLAEGEAPPCIGEYCRGLPQKTSDCLDVTGTELHRLSVPFGAIDLDPTAYATLFISLSVLIQVFVFISLGTLADYGPYRKKLLILTSIIGSVSTVLCFAVGTDTWWLGGFLTVFSNVAYGSTFVFYNGYLPLLAEQTEVVKKADPESHKAELDKEMERISANGFALGYLSGVLMILVSVPLGFVLETMDMYRLSIVLAGLWWFVFSLYTFKHLKPRPGPPLPEGASYCTLPWKSTWQTILQIKKLRHTFSFLLLWFMYSDGYTVISSIGALYANSEVDFGCFPKGLAIAIVFLEVPFAALLGSKIVEKVSRHNKNITAKKIIVASLVVFAVLPLYGLLGFVSNDIGLRKGWELWTFSLIFGLNLGVIQSYSRCLYATLIPPGSESQFFSLFEITDKGSSWLGPAVVSAVQQSTGNTRYAFIYIAVMLIAPALLLGLVDEKKGRADAIEFSKKRLAKLASTRQVANVEMGGVAGTA